MQSRNRSRTSFFLVAGTAAFLVCAIAPACHLINGIDGFTTDPLLDVVAKAPCLTDNDCPGTTTECGKQQCMSNACSSVFEPKGTAVLAQVGGDCKINQCDGAGNRVDGIVDESDVFDDGKECTIDACTVMGEPTNEPAAAGTSCATGQMVCDGKGTCVECAFDTDCKVAERICLMNHCVLKTCNNQMKDGQESDIDCGGTDCPPCVTGKDCMMGSDCESKTCTMNTCALPNCMDSQQNANETDVDCGGGTCAACADGLKCLIGPDCTSQVCTTNVCQVPTCMDGVQNGDEIATDCGGTCGTCPAGSKCMANEDCSSEFCLSGICAKIVQVATGTAHACAVVEAMPNDGKLYCWGGNNFGELGFGGVMTQQSKPTMPVNLTNVVSVSTSSNTTATPPFGGHTCARYAPGGVTKFACWGRNENGQLGNNSMTNSPQPVDIAFAPGITALRVVAGGRHTCAITSNKHVQCWGSNGHGQSGTGSATDNYYKTPQSVVGLNLPNPIGAEQLVLGTVHSCARLTSGEVACWGYDERGQVGFAVGSDQLKPRKLSTIAGVSELVAGQDFTCGLTGAQVFCWGDNSDKQFGAAVPTSTTTPLAVQNVAAIKPLPLTLGASGTTAVPDINGGHSCFIESGGKLVCLGLNDLGQVGNGSMTTPVNTPTQVNIEPVEQVALGTQFTCALLERGAIRCWGRNDLGQLGDDSTVNRSTPVAVMWP